MEFFREVVMIKRILILSMFFGATLVAAASAFAESVARPDVYNQDAIPAQTMSPGVTFRELTGANVKNIPARSTKGSVAYFQLAPGCASAWSYNRAAEETFIVIKGSGFMRIGSRSAPVTTGSFVLVPPGIVRSIKATAHSGLAFYAITAPSWTKEDDVVLSSSREAALSDVPPDSRRLK